MSPPPDSASSPPPLPEAQPLRTLEELRAWAPWQNPSDIFLRGSIPLRRPGTRHSQDAVPRELPLLGHLAEGPNGSREAEGGGGDGDDIRARSSPAPHPPLRGAAGAAAHADGSAGGVLDPAAALAAALRDGPGWKRGVPAPEGNREDPASAGAPRGNHGPGPGGAQLGAAEAMVNQPGGGGDSEAPRTKEGVEERRLLVCHDMAGGYKEDKWPQGIGCSSIYRIWDWPIVDTFVYFSHYHVTIPPPFWINCCHLQGTRVLGTFITEWTDGAAMCREILKSEESVRVCARQLALIAQFYRFDGWLFNIENEVDPESIPLLVLFVAALTEEVHALCPDPLVLWYDSVTKEGKLAWQNALNSHNLCFFQACDGIFTNYSWNEASRMPQESGEAAGPGRAGDVFMGVDVWAVPGRAGKGFRTGDVVGIAMGDGVSAAVFAPAWVYESRQPPSFFEASQRLWGGMHAAVEAYGGAQSNEECDRAGAQKWRGGCRAQAEMLPFFSAFDVGVGSAMWVQGRQVSASEWGNLSCQTCWPCLAPLASPASAQASAGEPGPREGAGSEKPSAAVGHSPSCLASVMGPASAPFPVTAVVTEAVAFEGGASLPISAKGFDPSQGQALRKSAGSTDCLTRIFTARLPSTRKLHVSYATLALGQAELCLVLTFQEGTGSESQGQHQPLDAQSTPPVESGLSRLHLRGEVVGLPPAAPRRSIMLLPSSWRGGPSRDNSPNAVALSPTAETVAPADFLFHPVAPPNEKTTEQAVLLPLVPSPWAHPLPCPTLPGTARESGTVGAPGGACVEDSPRSTPCWVVREYEVEPAPGMELEGISVGLWGDEGTLLGTAAPEALEGSAARGSGETGDEAQLFLGHVRIASASVAACLGSTPALLVRVEEAAWEQSALESSRALTARLSWEEQAPPGCPSDAAHELEQASSRADASQAASPGSTGPGPREGPCEGCALHRFDVFAALDPSQARADPGSAAIWQWIGVSFCQGFHVEKLAVPAGTRSLSFKVQPRMLCGARMPLDESPATQAIEVPSALEYLSK